MADPLQHNAVVLHRVADQREILARIDVPGAGVAGLDDVGGHDVEAAIGERQEIAAVVDANADVGLRQQVVVDVLEELRRLPHAVGELDDLDPGIGILRHGAWRGAAAHPDHQHVFGIAVQHHRQVADRAMQSHHVRLIVGLVEAIEIQHVLELRRAHADRRLRALVPPELEQHDRHSGD